MTASNVWVAYMDCPAAYAYILFSHMYCVCVCVCVQTIEKQTVDRMKRRHKNIHNEILMEKRVRA